MSTPQKGHSSCCWFDKYPFTKLDHQHIFKAASVLISAKADRNRSHSYGRHQDSIKKIHVISWDIFSMEFFIFHHYSMHTLIFVTIPALYRFTVRFSNSLSQHYTSGAFVQCHFLDIRISSYTCPIMSVPSAEATYLQWQSKSDTHLLDICRTVRQGAKSGGHVTSKSQLWVLVKLH